MLREILLGAITSQLDGRAMQIGTPADVVAPAAYGELVVRFPGADPTVGDASVWIPDERLSPSERVCSAAVSVGEVLVQYAFNNYDTHLAAPERATRVARDVVRFLRELFADRVLLWRSEDGSKRAWRERGDAGYLEPLVMDDSTYRRCLWSGPLPPWRATEAILAKGRIMDDRDHHLVLERLNRPGREGFVGQDLALALRLIADYRSRSDT